MLVGLCQWCGREFEPGRGQNGDTDYCPAQGPAAAALEQQIAALGRGAANAARSKKDQLDCPLQQQRAVEQLQKVGNPQQQLQQQRTQGQHIM